MTLRLQTELHIPDFNGVVVTAVKQQAKRMSCFEILIATHHVSTSFMQDWTCVAFAMKSAGINLVLQDPVDVK